MYLLHRVVPTLHYFLTLSPCKLRHFSYHWTSFCVPLSRKLAVKLFSQSCTASFALGHSADCPATQKFMQFNKLRIASFSEFFVFKFPFKSSRTKQGRPHRSSSRILTLPSLKFPHIPFIYGTYTTLFNNLPVNFCHTNNFSF